jgi:hypothetical protein
MKSNSWKPKTIPLIAQIELRLALKLSWSYLSLLSSPLRFQSRLHWKAMKVLRPYLSSSCNWVSQTPAKLYNRARVGQAKLTCYPQPMVALVNCIRWNFSQSTPIRPCSSTASSDPLSNVFQHSSLTSSATPPRESNLEQPGNFKKKQSSRIRQSKQSLEIHTPTQLSLQDISRLTQSLTVNS